MEITRGKQSKGVKFVIYGPEGIGKSTFVSKIPGVVFIDTEGSTGEMDVPRFPKPTSWSMLLEEVNYAKNHRDEVKALVIDTADWAERLCVEHVLQTHQVNGYAGKSIEDYGYGKGYVFLADEFGKLLNLMQDMSDAGIHVGFTAHAMMRKFEQPDETGTYDRWELKMTKKVAPLVKEWSSLMLFANYKTFVYATDEKGKKHKASGGQRVMFANHHPCWDAKNRYALPDEMPFEFSAIEKVFGNVQSDQIVTAPKSTPKKSIDEVLGDVPPLAEVPKDPEPVKAVVETVKEIPVQDQKPVDYTGIPEKLAALMKADNVLPFEVKAAIAQRGYFPVETPWECYPEDFVNGVLIGAWNQVKNMVMSNRDDGGVPF